VSQALSAGQGLGASGASQAGQPVFASIFAYYESRNVHELANFFEMPGDMGYSQLQIRNNTRNKKKTLAWMTGKSNFFLFLKTMSCLETLVVVFFQGGGSFVAEFDSTILAKFSVKNFEHESVKRILNENNHEIIR
jgi:hypothetical protein